MEPKYRTQKYEHDHQIRADYKNDKKSGGNMSRKMYFFKQILEKLGYSINTLSEKSGFSPQLIGWWMIADNCKYGNLVKALKSINVGIMPSFENRDGEKRIIVGDSFEVRGTLPNTSKTRKVNIGAEILDNRIEQGGNLQFLAKFIKDTGMTLAAFSKKINTDYSSMRRWLINDDISIQKLYQIADTFEKKIIWNTTDLSESTEK